MKISLSEIWNFSDLINASEKGWSFGLHAGKAFIPSVSSATLRKLKDDKDFDTELLPSLFTFREILWQPDVYTEASMSLPGLRILHAFCEETSAELDLQKDGLGSIYSPLVRSIGESCEFAAKSLEITDTDVRRVLGELRRDVFPIVKFFIFHPQNRLDYYRDAVNRLNYAVKIMLTQFNGRYTELEDPFWEVLYEETAPKPKQKAEKDAPEVTKEPKSVE